MLYKHDFYTLISEKIPYRGRGITPPPPPRLGRFAPSPRTSDKCAPFEVLPLQNSVFRRACLSLLPSFFFFILIFGPKFISSFLSFTSTFSFNFYSHFETEIFSFDHESISSHGCFLIAEVPFNPLLIISSLVWISLFDVSLLFVCL